MSLWGYDDPGQEYESQPLVYLTDVTKPLTPDRLIRKNYGVMCVWDTGEEHPDRVTHKSVYPWDRIASVHGDESGVRVK